MNGDAPEIPDDYNFYASTNCTNPSASGCSDPRNSVYWASKFGSFSICAEDADERFTTLCPKSDYSTKCFADRGLDIDNSRITGNYARWWAEEQAESGTSYSVVEIFNQYVPSLSSVPVPVPVPTPSRHRSCHTIRSSHGPAISDATSGSVLTRFRPPPRCVVASRPGRDKGTVSFRLRCYRRPCYWRL